MSLSKRRTVDLKERMVYVKQQSLNPKEKMRFKVQRFLSSKKFVIPTSILIWGFWFLLLNWVANFLVMSITPLLHLSKMTAFYFPKWWSFHWTQNWLIFYFVDALFATISTVRYATNMIFSFEVLSDTSYKGHRRWTTLRELKRQYHSIPATEPDRTKAEIPKLYLPAKVIGAIAPQVKESCWYQNQMHKMAITGIGDIHGSGGFPISRYKSRIFIDRDAVHNLIIGMSRSGKGETYILPRIDICSRPRRMKDKASMIIGDLKGELSATTISKLKERGYITMVLSLKSPMDGLSYNPLEIVKNAYIQFLQKRKEAAALPCDQKNAHKRSLLFRDADSAGAEAEIYAKALAYIINFDKEAREKIWQLWGTSITTAAILAVVCDCCEAAQKCLDKGDKTGAQKWYARITMYSVARFVVDYSKPDPESGIPPIDKYIMSKKWTARYQYSPVNAADGRTKGNITAEALAHLNQLMLAPVAKLMAKNDIDFKEIGFGERPIALFLVLPEGDKSNNFILTMFLTQLYQILIKETDKMRNQKCKREVLFVLDEFGNLPPMPNMDTMITACLGRNIRFDLVVQSLTQLDTTYGKDAAATIKGNCSNWIYLLSNDPDTQELMSKQIGQKAVVVTSRYGNPMDSHKNMQESVEAVPLLSADDLKELGPGESVVCRVMHRNDKRGKTVRQNPILNYGPTKMLYRYEYLGKTFPSGRSFLDLNLADVCTHLNIDLNEIAYDPVTQGLADAKILKKQKAKVATQVPVTPPLEAQVVPFETSSAMPFYSRLSEQSKQQLSMKLRAARALDDDTYEKRTELTLTQLEAALNLSLKQGRIEIKQFNAIRKLIENAIREKNKGGTNIS